VLEVETVQPPLPLQALLQPVKVESAAAVAVSATAAPSTKVLEQVEPQLIPSGSSSPCPRPAPAFVAVSVRERVKVAVTCWSLLSCTWHVPVPEQPPPDQPLKTGPAAGIAVNVTGTAAKGAEHVDPQLIPARLELTVPVPTRADSAIARSTDR
jgi:hypothetical protein